MSKDKLPPPAEEFFPSRKSLNAFRDAAADCQACDLWKRGTQTVFGEGARRAEVFFIGEQPGNEEDLSGKPFVGPAGRLLNDTLGAAGIDRKQVYVTNVVKHFKWEPRGQFIESTLAPYIMTTVHPSSILRAPDDETRHMEKRRFIDDLKKVARA